MEKATIIDGKDSSLYRKDKYGNPIFYRSYGKETPQGWEIDHFLPVSKGGTDRIDNLQPLQWAENRRKSNHYPYTVQTRSSLMGG